ncbi:hypothetical protein Tco_1038928 [Tanacetum coccineum]
MATLPICDQLRISVNSPDWEPQFILRCHREICKDLRMAREINALCARVTAIVDERESFVDELDMLARRHVLGKRCFHREAEGERGLLNPVVFCVFLVC